MRASIILFALLFAAGSALSGDGKQYGKSLSVKEVTKISDIMAKPDKYNGKRVLVEGSIVDVCAKRGCWMKIASDKEFESITFKVDDGVIIFPMDAKGKKARGEGVISVKKYSVEQQIESGKKHAKEENEEFDPASVKGPKTVILLKGEGAVID